ncbi:MAG: hypothetical protein AB7J86_15825 [Vulcanimicrobiota bacterium]
MHIQPGQFETPQFKVPHKPWSSNTEVAGGGYAADPIDTVTLAQASTPSPTADLSKMTREQIMEMLRRMRPSEGGRTGYG